MLRSLAIAALGLLLHSPLAAQPRPSPEEQARTLAIARAAALRYGKTLPDFLCTETIDRNYLVNRSERKRDHLQLQVSYFEQKEYHKLLTINGRKTNRSFETLDGLLSAGEFGSLLVYIFDPESATDFEWKGHTTIGERRGEEYTYRVKSANSQYAVGFRNSDGRIEGSYVGYRGEVILDSESSTVRRLSLEALDIPEGLAILKATMWVEYDWRDVAGTLHLLPVRAESVMQRKRGTIRNNLSFADYRKFSADSVLTFQ